LLAISRGILLLRLGRRFLAMVIVPTGILLHTRIARFGRYRRSKAACCEGKRDKQDNQRPQKRSASQKR
jgi:hypothetical protein